MEFYDTHAHLDYPDFQKDFEALLERAKTAGISKVISIGTDWESSDRVLKLAENYSQIYAVVGWHPCGAMKAPEDIRPKLRELAGHPKVVALGETGIDYHHPPAPSADGRIEFSIYKEKQQRLFEQHLEVAAEMGLNVVIHQREAFEETLQTFRPFSSRVRGVFHCFVDRPAWMHRVVDLGSLVSFTGIATFKNAVDVRHTISETPFGSLMLETDCPFLAPMPFRGKRCEPAYVRYTAEKIAEVRKCSLEDLATETCLTAQQFFRGL